MNKLDFLIDYLLKENGTINIEKLPTDIKKENIKYYGIELLNTEIKVTKSNATIKSKSKIRAKLFDCRGSWTKTIYMEFIKENGKWIITDFCI